MEKNLEGLKLNGSVVLIIVIEYIIINVTALLSIKKIIWLIFTSLN